MAVAFFAGAVAKTAKDFMDGFDWRNPDIDLARYHLEAIYAGCAEIEAALENIYEPPAPEEIIAEKLGLF